VFNSQTAETSRISAFIRASAQQQPEIHRQGLTRLTVWGALYVAVVCLLPEILISQFRVPFYFGGTSLLIIVVVIMDFMAQLQAHLMSHQYEGLMKKANLRGYGRSGQLR
jgi:preprotein translocase subunit SecY